MDHFLLRKRAREPSPSPSPLETKETSSLAGRSGDNENDDESTDMKLAKLVSIFPDIEHDQLLDLLIANEGSVASTCSTLSDHGIANKKRAKHASDSGTIQSSLSSYRVGNSDNKANLPRKPPPTRKGQVLHLFSPEDISCYTSCSIIHNFLPQTEATALLNELLQESQSFERQRFQLFDNIVQSPHSTGFYVASAEEQRQQKSEYAYNGSYRTDVRQLTPELRKVSSKVQRAVNDEIQSRIQSHYPGGKKLLYQSPREWEPNAAFVNCYDGPTESVGYHSDELTYLGPRAVIGSLSLGVAREFRVRKIVPPDEEEDDGSGAKGGGRGESGDASPSTRKEALNSNPNPSRADIQGQISIHLPHNSLLVMHAETQEEWKHSISPAQTVSPHAMSGNKRINVTYRWYRDSLHPRNTPRCRCEMPCVLRCVQRKKETRGKYMWLCYAGYAPGKKSCSYFQWAKFDDDGEPIWEKK